MSNRRSITPRLLTGVLAGTAALAVAAAGTTTATAAHETSTYTASAARGAQTASITVLPGIAQPGKRAASSAAAKLVVSATTSPASKPGRKATLERFDGATWAPVAKGKVTDAKAAEFTVTPSLATADLRVTFAAGGGQGAVTTGSATAAAWGEADFTDDFAGGTLGSEWSHRGLSYNKHGLRRCSKGSPKAAKVKSGTLQLSVMADKQKSKKLCVARKADGKTIGKFKYRLNGHVSTAGQVSLKYGVVAARMKFQKLKGQHASFWLQPNEMKANAASAKTGGAEIDVIEWFGGGGRNDGLTSFVYAPSKKGLKKIGGYLGKTDKYLMNKKDAWYKNYHVFSVHWTPQEYVFRIDGHETFRTKKGVSGVPQYVILSLLSSDYELKNLGGEKKLPQKFNVDWVRVWQDKTQL